MEFLDQLVPSGSSALMAVDIFNHIIHLALIFFLLFGWLSKRLVKAHFITTIVVWASWLALGLYVGHIGYCVLTDWHWRVKIAAGEANLPMSYLEYIYTAISGKDVEDSLVSWIAGAMLGVITIISAFRFFRAKAMFLYCFRKTRVRFFR